MLQRDRFIVWRRGNNRAPDVRTCLSEFPDLEVIRSADDMAVVQMSEETADEIKSRFPQFSVELDLKHHLVER